MPSSPGRGFKTDIGKDLAQRIITELFLPPQPQTQTLFLAQADTGHAAIGHDTLWLIARHEGQSKRSRGSTTYAAGRPKAKGTFPCRLGKSLGVWRNNTEKASTRTMKKEGRREQRADCGTPSRRAEQDPRNLARRWNCGSMEEGRSVTSTRLSRFFYRRRGLN